MAGLPKKYARMGFKKGWKLFKATKRSKSTPVRAVKTMARKRRTIRAYKRPSKIRRSRKGSNSSMLMTIGGAMGYGAVRQRVSNMLIPLTSRIPAGEIADELGMLGINYLVAKGKVPLINKIGVMRKVGYAGLIVESARIGEYLANRVTTGNTTKQITGQSFR